MWSPTRQPCSTIVLVSALLGCGGDGVTGGGGGPYGTIPIVNSGLGGAGFGGYANTAIPDRYNFLFARQPFQEEQQCLDTGACGHGGIAASYADLQSGGTLLFVTTSDFSTEVNGNGPFDAVVQVSGVEHEAVTLPTSATGKGLRLAFDYAFLVSHDVPQDSAVVKLVIDGAPVTIFKITRADLGGSVPVRQGGCGEANIGFTATFPICSDWRSATADLKPYRGKTTPIQFVVAEPTRIAGRAVTLLIRQLRVEEEQ